MFKKRTEEEKIIKAYNKGKGRYYILSILITAISNMFTFYFGLRQMGLNMLTLEGFDYLYLSLLILGIGFMIYNIFVPVITGGWDGIEQKYNELMGYEVKKDETKSK